MTPKHICSILKSNGFEAYIVGGAVRDTLLNKQVKDYDITTNATPEQIITMFPYADINIVGKSFGVVIIDNTEVATYRLDRFEQELNAKSCKPIFSDNIQDDLARRDLTINAIAMDSFSGDIIDPFDGRKDLLDKIIRFVGNPVDRITEDPCRILRACRFLAEIEGVFDTDTLTAIKERAHYIINIPKDRIRNEIIKAMSSDYPSLFFGAMSITGVLRYVFPTMCICVDHEHGNHHIENIWEHLMLTGDTLHKKDPTLRLTGYLHDIGKPLSFDGDKFIEHESFGYNILKQELKDLNFSNNDIERITNLVLVHMRTCRGLTPRGIRRLRKTLHDLNVDPRDYIRLKLADRQANIKNGPNKISKIKSMVINVGIKELEPDLPMTVKDLALSGGEIIKKFGLAPGPIVGSIQKHLLAKIIDLGEEFNTKDFLTDETRSYLEVYNYVNQ